MPNFILTRDESLDYTRYPTLFAQVPEGVIPLQTEQGRRIILSGTCGEKLQFVLDGEYTLTIRGKGDMDNYWNPEEDIPWKNFPVKKVIAEEGVTSLGSAAFYGCEHLEEIRLPDSLRYLSPNCLHMTAIRELYIPNSVQIICPQGDLPALAEISLPDALTYFALLDYLAPRGDTPLYVHFRGGPPYRFMLQAFGQRKVIATYPVVTNGRWPVDLRSQFTGDITWEAWGLDDTRSPLRSEEPWFNFKRRSGRCGPNLRYTIDAENTLIISGVGDMYNYSSGQETPWHRFPIQKAIIKRGVSSIGTYAFEGCTSLKMIRLPLTLRHMGGYCLHETGIRHLVIPDSVLFIGDVLGDLPAITMISLPGNLRTFRMLASVKPRNGAAVDVFFHGDPPFYYYDDSLGPNKIRAYYPASNPKWTEEMRGWFQGDITWIPKDYKT